MEHLTEGQTWREKARAASDRGDRPAELEALIRCVAHIALADEDSTSTIQARGEANRRLADLLADGGDWPGAMPAYQEAADAFGRLPGFDEQARECARRIRDGVRALRLRPDDRLFILIARYERDLRNLEVQTGAEKERADCLVHIATILHRCERYNDAAVRFEEALALYCKVDETGLERARTAKMLGDIYFGPLEDDIRAFRYYRQADREFAHEEDLVEADWFARQECGRRLRDLATDLTDVQG